MLLFVYGSLLQGEENHAALGDSLLLGKACTAPRYTLVDLGPYPAMVTGGETQVLGELYEVPEEATAGLDEFEGHPDLYVRVLVELSDGAAVNAYVLPRERLGKHSIIASGDWRGRREAG